MYRIRIARLNTIVYSVIFLVTLWIIYIMFFGKGGILERKKIIKEIGVLQSEIQSLKNEKLRLKWEIDNLKKSGDYTISIAHSYGYRFEDEIIFKFMKNPTGGKNTSDNASNR